MEFGDKTWRQAHMALTLRIEDLEKTVAKSDGRDSFWVERLSDAREARAALEDISAFQ